MYTFLLLSLFFISMLNGERYEPQLESSQEMFMPRSVAANYLFGPPIRRYQYPLLDSPIDNSLSLVPSDQNSGQQQRTKRIYWENLAFHASDFNRKTKKTLNKD